MTHDTLTILTLLAARLPLYLYVVYVGYRYRGKRTPISFTALLILGLLGTGIALVSAFTEQRLIRDLLGGAFAVTLFIIAYRANQKIGGNNG